MRQSFQTWTLQKFHPLLHARQIPFNLSRLMKDNCIRFCLLLILLRPAVINLCAEGLCNSFTNLINTSFRLGQYPSAWKFANVLPLFKKDDRQLKTNYRPVSLLIVLIQNLRESCLFSPLQFLCHHWFLL